MLKHEEGRNPEESVRGLAIRKLKILIFFLYTCFPHVLREILFASCLKMIKGQFFSFLGFSVITENAVGIQLIKNGCKREEK